jgi:hypothetical protein
VAGGDIGARNEMQAIERLACGEWLEGNHNVVRASEFESVVAQTVLLSPMRRGFSSLQKVIGTTTLYSKCAIKG